MSEVFLFLYPIPEYIDFEIKNLSYSFRENEAITKQRYSKILNTCIDIRYRQRGFSINYAVFNNHKISDAIDLQINDRIIQVGMDFTTHTTPLPDETYPYPNPDFILSQLGNIEKIRVAGFHMWDCVEKVAQRAYEKGLDTLVDEDLTEFLFFRHTLNRVSHHPEKYPTYNPRKDRGLTSDLFIEARKGKPWLWQDY